MILKERFINLWQKYFDGSELPVIFFYTGNAKAAPKAPPPKGHKCLIADIAGVRKGKALLFDVESVGCFGGKRYLGFSESLMPKFDYFLSYGLPGEVEGERYKKTPQIVNEIMKSVPIFKAPERYILFKRWDGVNETDDPVAAIFFGTPDVISGLFTLANYDETDRNGVVSPFGAGCTTIITYPYMEKDAEHPRGVLGMFDVSARPCVPPGVITFAVPMKKLKSMIDNMEESFLTTESWKKVQKRIALECKKSKA